MEMSLEEFLEEYQQVFAGESIIQSKGVLKEIIRGFAKIFGRIPAEIDE